jgi:mRNA interferase RelE/StbE
VYKILFTKSADRALRRLPRDLSQRIRERLNAIAVDPYAQHPNVTKLHNRPGYRLRVGDWRVIYEIEGEELTILVLRIGPRGEVYR